LRVANYGAPGQRVQWHSLGKRPIEISNRHFEGRSEDAVMLSTQIG
jgi:hypothetical protein